MNKFFFSLTIVLLILSCNNDDSTKTAEGGKKEKEITPQVQALQQRLQQHPDSSGLRMKLAMELDSLNMFKPALAQMDSLIAKDSSNYGLWYTRAQVNEHAGDTSHAIRDYTAAARINPTTDALLNLANLYAEQRNPRSLLLCKQVKEMGQGRDIDASAAFIAGIYNSRTGQKETALQLFDECIGNDYTYMPAYIEKGLVYFDAKQYRQALDVFSFAADVNHLYPDAYYYMGRCYELMNRKDSAAYYFKQSLALDKESSETEAALQRVEK